ncbi:putative amidoligase domain-containing protein [Lihuaxuella thermophila]|uniref:Phage phiEco32-like COOH.NH2 ligase-type 2 n=1 Tax=Lihuaxuella thermophila TaxID=1173111 RepID=A0A1H8GHI0_9BACL|nr:hypothetical protein [Lihuaxuella thermophila]SEN43259.1 Phage phiEco32-like COOH.NH2 ligase-type 2 [Lihuaxuella thermophila]
MGAVTLPYNALENENLVREIAIVNDRRMATSIRLDSPAGRHLSESMLILNDESQVKRALDSKLRKETLELHGVPVSVNGPLIRQYVVCIFQTRVLVMYRSKGQAWTANNRKHQRLSFQRVSLQEQGKEVRKIQTTAIRALYALGLDYGVVKCGVGAGQKIAVTQVIPGPRLNAEMENGLIRAILQYVKKLKEPKVSQDQIVLGADPEFVMKSPKGHLLMASNYFPTRGRIGCDAIWMGANHANKPLVEIRPEPTSDPRTIVVRIYQGLLQAAKKMHHSPAKWLAGNMPYNGFPLGGHIHFSGIRPDFKMLRALDNYLSLLLVVVEDERGKGRRPKYGFLGDFRYQKHGGFEYRTPPSWLVSPTLTKGVFVTAKLIVANYRTLKYNPLADFAIQQAYYTGDKDKIFNLVPVLWEDLKKLDDYQLYKKYLDEFYRYLTSGITWDETQDFRKYWRIPPYHKQKEGVKGVL